MKNIITCILDNTTMEFDYSSLGRIEQLVYISLCELDRDTSSFNRTRFGVSSDTVKNELDSLCEDEIVVEDVRLTYGGDKRFYYRIEESIDTHSYDTLSEEEVNIITSICKKFDDYPVSNLQNTAAEHNWSF